MHTEKLKISWATKTNLIG